MAKKGSVFYWRLAACLFAVSIFFLILSSSLLHHFDETPLLPASIYRLLLPASAACIKPKTPPFNPSTTPLPPLKVFMYNLPPEFHFGSLGWRPDGDQIWPNLSTLRRIPTYPRGMHMQHSMEYWLTLDLLSQNLTTPSTAVLVQNSAQADVVFVPFFSSWSYNRQCKIVGDRRNSMDYVLQERLVEFLKGRDEWRRSQGKDHLIMAHHPNSLLLARRHLGSAMLMLADFGRYPPWVANVSKDFIVPYKHLVPRLSDSPPFEGRPVLAYFQGGIHRKDGGRIRQEIYDVLRDEKDVHFKFGRPSSDGIHEASEGMASSKFCLTIAGDTPSSNRLFDAIVSHCVPVVISDKIELPFEDVLDYTQFAIFVAASDAAKSGYLIRLLRGVEREKWTQMWERLKQIAPHFEYQYPSQPGDAVDMIWQAVQRKVFSVSNDFYKRKRYYHTRCHSSS